MIFPQVEVRLNDAQKAQFPDWEEQAAAFQLRFNHQMSDLNEKFRLCVHEASHMVWYRRIGWTIKGLHGPHIRLNEEGMPINILGSVTPVRGDFHHHDARRELIEGAKAKIAGFVLVEAITGEPENETIIENDMGFILTFDPDVRKDVMETATEEILSELNDPDFMLELIGAVCEYENAVFQTNETWLWGWKEYRLDIAGQRYVVGPGWLLIEHENQLRFFVQFNGKELLPNDENFHYMVPPSAKSGGERAADAVRRWNEMVRAAEHRQRTFPSREQILME